MDEDTGCVFGLKKGSIPCPQADANGPGEEFSMQLTRFYHQSVGLIQRIIESSGIPTISISINRPYTEKIKPPRSIFLDWPFGHPLGNRAASNSRRRFSPNASKRWIPSIRRG